MCKCDVSMPCESINSWVDASMALSSMCRSTCVLPVFHCASMFLSCIYVEHGQCRLIFLRRSIMCYVYYEMHLRHASVHNIHTASKQTCVLVPIPWHCLIIVLLKDPALLLPPSRILIHVCYLIITSSCPASCSILFQEGLLFIYRCLSTTCSTDSWEKENCALSKSLSFLYFYYKHRIVSMAFYISVNLLLQYLEKTWKHFSWYSRTKLWTKI